MCIRDSSSIDATDLLSDIKSDLLPEEVFAFTPRGDVINLPAGATVIDFAYAIHSAVGNRMIGAKVNNRIVPIDHQVVTGEIIEIITEMCIRDSLYNGHSFLPCRICMAGKLCYTCLLYTSFRKASSMPPVIICPTMISGWTAFWPSWMI